MVQKSRKGISLPKLLVNTKVVLTGEYEQDDVLFCKCELEFDKHTELYKNVVYCPKRPGFIELLRVRLNGKMPNVVHLTVIKRLSKTIN